MNDAYETIWLCGDMYTPLPLKYYSIYMRSTDNCCPLCTILTSRYIIGAILKLDVGVLDAFISV